MSEEGDIKKLKEMGLSKEAPDIKKQTIDMLTNYGRPAIDAILEIIAKADDEEVKEYGLEAIKRITKKNNNAWGFTKV